MKNSDVITLLNIIILNDEEKEQLLTSLEKIKFQMNDLVEKFYAYFLQTKAGQLFENTDMMKQHAMFNSSIGVIISYIDHPMLLQEHLDNLIRKHSHYGVMTQFIDDFIESFKKAIIDIFPGPDNKHNVELWYKLINSVMLYFKMKLGN